MENATKALNIAGAILITMLIVAIGVQVYNGIQEMPMSEEERLEAEEIEKFNSKFNIYNNKSLYQAEFKSVINKIEDNNALADQDRRTSKIDYVIKDTTGANISLVFDDNNNIVEIQDGTETRELPSFWKCTKIEYTDGRVSKMTFQAKKTK